MTKEEILKKHTGHFLDASIRNADYKKCVLAAMEEYATHQPFQQLISWMEERVIIMGKSLELRELKGDMYGSKIIDFLTDELKVWLTKAKELASQPGEIDRAAAGLEVFYNRDIWKQYSEDPRYGNALSYNDFLNERKLVMVKEDDVKRLMKEIREYLSNNPQPGWVSVAERLPENGERVGVYNLNVALMCMGIAFYNDGFYFDTTLMPDKYVDIMNKKLKVTHWAYLPSPPKQ